jgi:hypothetical protein
MPKRIVDRIDTPGGPWHAAACVAAANLAAVVACSPGAPATQSESNVPEFSNIPGVGPANGPPAPSSSGSGLGDPCANPTSEGNIPVSGLDSTSQPDPASEDESSAAEGSASANPPPSSGEPAGGEPSNEGAPPAAGEPGAGESGSGTCALDVTVTTAPHGGRYTPRNVGAIWIANAAGSYVKSLDVWGNRRLSHVEAWIAATGAAGVPQDRVDAVTGATSATHRTHLVSWDCTDHQGQLVPDGTYRVYFEVTEANAAGPNHFETFEKGSTAVALQANATNFQGIELAFQP